MKGIAKDRPVFIQQFRGLAIRAVEGKMACVRPGSIILSPSHPDSQVDKADVERIIGSLVEDQA